MMAVEKGRILSSSFLGPSPDDGPLVGQLDFGGNVDGVGQHKRTLKNRKWAFSARGLEVCKHEDKALDFVDIFLSHISDGILSPHILPPLPPPNKVTAGGKDGPPFLWPTQAHNR